MIQALLVTLSLSGLGVTHWLWNLRSQPSDFPPPAPQAFDVPYILTDHTGLT